MRELSAQEFEQAISSPQPILIKFTAGWCRPCQVVQPSLDRIAAAHPEIQFAKVDIDRSPEIAKSHNVQGVPHFLVFANGRELKRFAGALPQSLIERQLAPFFGGLAVQAPQGMQGQEGFVDQSPSPADTSTTVVVEAPRRARRSLV